MEDGISTVEDVVLSVVRDSVEFWLDVELDESDAGSDVESDVEFWDVVALEFIEVESDAESGVELDIEF